MKYRDRQFQRNFNVETKTNGDTERVRISQRDTEMERVKYPERGRERETQRMGGRNQKTGNEGDIEEEKQSGKESLRK